MKKIKLRKYQKIAIIIILLLISITLAGFWIYQYYQTGIKVGLIDSGVRFDSGIKSKSFVDTKYGYEENEEAYDLVGHGTQVMELIEQYTPSNIKIKFFSAKVANTDKTIHYEAIIAAANWLASQEVKFIVMSLGGWFKSNSNYTDAFYDLAASGIIIIAASGNNGHPAYDVHGLGDFPALLPWVIGVGATSVTLDGVLGFSSGGRGYQGSYAADVTDVANNIRGTQQGTSFAVPRVVAKALQILHAAEKKGIELNVNEMGALLSKSAGNTFSPEYGFGYPDVNKAIDLLDGEPFAVLYGGNGHLFNENYPRFRNETWSDIIYYREYGDLPIDKHMILHYRYNQSIDIDSDSLLSFKENIKVIIKESNHTLNSSIEIKYTGPFKNLYQLNVTSYIGYRGEVPSDYLTNPNATWEHKIYSNLIKFTTNFIPTYNYNFLFDYTGVKDYRFLEYGVYTNMTYTLRNEGFLTDFTYNRNELDLRQYDIIFSPYLLNRKETSFIIQYVQEGGTWFIGLSRIYEMSIMTTYIPELNLTIIELERRDLDKATAYPYPHILTTNITEMYYEGVGLLINQTASPLGYIEGSEGNYTIGYTYNYGLGTIILFGSSATFADSGYYYSVDNYFISNLNEYLK